MVNAGGYRLSLLAASAHLLILSSQVTCQEDAWLAVINNKQSTQQEQPAQPQQPQNSYAQPVQDDQYRPPQDNRRSDFAQPDQYQQQQPAAAAANGQPQEQSQRRNGDQETIYNYVEQPVDLPPVRPLQQKPQRPPPPPPQPSSGRPVVTLGSPPAPPGQRRPSGGQAPRNPQQKLIGRIPQQPPRIPGRRPLPPSSSQPGFNRPGLPPPHLRKRPVAPKKSQGILQGISGAINHAVGDGICAAQGLYADDKLKDPAFINYQLKCILGRGECDEVGNLVKRMAPDILRGGCPPPCDPCKKKQIQKVMATLSSKYPKEFKKLIQKYGK